MARSKPKHSHSRNQPKHQSTEDGGQPTPNAEPLTAEVPLAAEPVTSGGEIEVVQAVPPHSFLDGTSQVTASILVVDEVDSTEASRCQAAESPVIASSLSEVVVETEEQSSRRSSSHVQQETPLSEAAPTTSPCSPVSSKAYAKRLKGGKLVFSFAAAGWLQTYHFGVAKALQELGLDQDVDVHFCGSSAGSLAAAALVTKVDFDALCDYAVDCVADCHASLFNAFRIREYVLVGIERFAVDRFRKDAQLREALNKRLEVYVSILPWCRKKVMRHFETAEDLEEALVASCCLVPLAGLPLKLRHSGEWVCDGGLTAFQPRKGEPHVVTVSAMYFNRADIRPSSFVPSWWGLYPPSQRQYREIYHEGYRDAIEFLVKEAYIEPSARELLNKPQHAQFLHRNHHHQATASHRSDNIGGEDMSWSDIALDIATGIAFMVFIRPWALFFIYGEMFLSSAVLLVVAFANLTKGASWENWYHAVRNMLSFRVFVHFLVGKKVPVNLGRLEKHSRVYRILKPLLYG